MTNIWKHIFYRYIIEFWRSLKIILLVPLCLKIGLRKSWMPWNEFVKSKVIYLSSKMGCKNRPRYPGRKSSIKKSEIDLSQIIWHNLPSKMICFCNPPIIRFIKIWIIDDSRLIMVQMSLMHKKRLFLTMSLDQMLHSTYHQPCEAP